MKKTRMLGLGMVVLALLHFNAFALQFGLTGEFSNGTAPTGSTPWATVDISDFGKNVRVTFTIGDNDIGKLTEWYLNFNQAQDPSQLQFNSVNSSAVKSWTAQTGVNKFKADGDGTYDIKFSFATSGNVFKTGETLSFEISSKTGADLGEADFNYLSVGGAKGSFHTAAHVQALSANNGASGWVGDTPGSNPSNGVPDGSWTVTLLGMGVVSLEFLRRKLRKHEAKP